MAGPGRYGRRADGAEATLQHGPDRGGGGDRRRVPPPHLLPLDDVLGCLREAIPALSRSALHRCLARHGISRLPEGGEKASKRKRFAQARIGHVHVDACQLRSAEGEKLKEWLQS